MRAGRTWSRRGWCVRRFERSGQGLTAAVSPPQHRHRDLCRHFDIRPFAVVTDFARAFRATRNLPPGTVPSFEDPTPEQESERQGSEPSTRSMSPASILRMSSGYSLDELPDESIDESSDFDSMTTMPMGPSAAAPKLKGKRPVRSRASSTVLVPDSEEERLALEDAGSKRKLRGPPSASLPSSKRPRPARSSAEPELLDLSGRTFREYSDVSKEVIPWAERRVSSSPARPGPADLC
jgi:hypothetical protein